jgi:hypothetical protein
VAAEKNREGGLILFLFFTESHLVGARNKYAQTQLYGIIFSKLLHFSVILQFIKELCLYTRVYQLSIYELVFQNGRPS